MRYLPVLLLAVLLSGCATTPVTISRAVVYNETGSDISKVTVLHQPTLRSGGVSGIPAGTSLDIGFSKTPMLAERAEVKWSDRAGQQHNVKVLLPNNQVRIQETEMQLVYIIDRFGSVSVKLEPLQSRKMYIFPQRKRSQ